MSIVSPFFTFLIWVSTALLALPIYLTYVIWKYSPQSMETYKIFMIKMEVCDILFQFTVDWLFQPNLLFPLPAASVEGFFKYIGQNGGWIAHGTICYTGVLTIYSVNDCCIGRWMIMYGKDNWLEHFAGKLGLAYFTSLWVVTGSFCYCSCFYLLKPTSFLISYAEKNNDTAFLVDITSDTVVVAFDIHEMTTIAGAIFVVIYLIGCEGMNIGLSWAVQMKLNKARSVMSSGTFKMQRSLTVVLLLQAIIPFVGISIPVMIYLLSFSYGIEALYQSALVKWTSTIILGMYPTVNCLACIFLMKPYRVHAIKWIKRAIFWKKYDQISPIVEVTTSSTPGNSNSNTNVIRRNG